MRGAGIGRRLRCLAGLVAVLCLAGQFSSLAHNLLVQHSTCAEHGEIVHADGEASAAGAAARSSGGGARSGATATLSETGGAGESHGHDHCLAVAHGRGHVALQTDATGTTSATPALLEVSPQDTNDRPVIRVLYRLAPKNSPPA